MTFMVKEAFFSKKVQEMSKTKKIAYFGVFTAFSVVSNMFFEFKYFDIQYSLTIFVSIAIGMFLGSIYGFATCMLGDFVGYIFNSWGQLYMPWVGISTGLFALIGGFIINGFETKKKWSIYIKLVVIMITTFLICTVGVNSVGFYFYNKEMGFSTAVIDYVTENFGGNISFLSYVAYRLIFKGQIFNSIFNYALMFAFLPLLRRIKL